MFSFWAHNARVMKPVLPFDNRLGLRVHEVAEALGVRPATIRDWIAAGELPAARLGGVWLISPDALRERMTGLPAGWAPGRFL